MAATGPTQSSAATPVSPRRRRPPHTCVGDRAALCCMSVLRASERRVTIGSLAGGALQRPYALQSENSLVPTDPPAEHRRTDMCGRRHRPGED